MGILTLLLSCNGHAKRPAEETKANLAQLVDPPTSAPKPPKVVAPAVETSIPLQAAAFVKALKAGAELAPYFSDNWGFTYHEDNRCDGATDGQLGPLTSGQIDGVISLQVHNDGEGWACDAKEAKTYGLDFDLKKKVSAWDRVEIPQEESGEADVVYVVGAGASDYIKLHFNAAALIIQLEYRSEDPG